MEHVKFANVVTPLALAIALASHASVVAAEGGDTRCTYEDGGVLVCMGSRSPNEGMTGEAQDAILLDARGSRYGLIVKDFDYLVDGDLRRDVEAEPWGGAWRAGIAVAGHMSQRTYVNPEYDGHAMGLYARNVTIRGTANDGKQIAGILHYNAYSAAEPHTDRVFLRDVDIDISNAVVTPNTSTYPWLVYRAFGVLSETEGTNKNNLLSIDGVSTIAANRVCQIGQSCFMGAPYDMAAVRASSSRGHSVDIVLGEDVTLISTGDRVHGAWAGTRVSTSTSKIDNAGIIITDGQQANAIRIDNDGGTQTTSGRATVVNRETGILETYQDQSDGVQVINFTDIVINNEGEIRTYGENSRGIAALHKYRWSNLNRSGNTVINLGPNSTVAGGYGANAAGLYLTHSDGSHVINNAGLIQSDNFHAISVDYSGVDTGDVTLTNSGQIEGFQTINGINVNVDNQADGVFALMHFHTEGPELGEKAPVISRFSSNETAVFNNAGSIRFHDYMNGSPPPNSGGFTGINTFHHQSSGIIDLAANNPRARTGFGMNNYVGDRFSITNSTGSAIFYSDGGLVTLNTDLFTANKATTEERLTDRLIVDKAMKIRADAEPTYLDIVPTARSRTGAQLARGDGFKVVQVNTSSTNDAFALAAPVVAGNKQYVLTQIDNKDWHLVSQVASPSSGTALSLYNPSVGVNLANQTAMVNLTAHSLADRIGERTSGVRNSVSYSSSLQYDKSSGTQRPAFWIQSSSNQSSASVSSSLDSNASNNIVRMGGDLMSLKRFDGDLHVGWMMSSGDSRINTVGSYTGTRAKGTQHGYSSGVYGTWYADEKSGHGLYVDGWTQFGTFDNTVTGVGSGGDRERYRSQIFSTSLEAGYSVPLNGGNGSETGWVLTPQAQITHHQLHSEGYEDNNLLSVKSGKVSGVVTRLGARLSSTNQGLKLGKALLQPYAEANWISDGVNNQLAFNGESLKEKRARDIVEAKLGFQGELKGGTKLWGQVSSRFGEDTPGIDRYGMQVGMSFNW